jgi:hypothetical protein
MEAEQADGRAAKLQAADLDLCRLLRDWKRTGWSRSFEQRLGDGYALYGVDSRAVVKAHETVVGLVPRLQKLGLTHQQSIRIAALVPGEF